MEVMTASASLPLEPGAPLVSEREREQLLNAFLQKNGLEDEECLPLPSDASGRQYSWFSHALLMDAPPPHEDTKAFEHIARLLLEVGLSTPKIYAADHLNGFLLLEDFGDLTYRHALEEGISEALLYEEAINALVHLHKEMRRNTTGLPSYDRTLFLDRASLFTMWYDLPFSVQAKADFLGLWEEAFQNQPPVPQRLILRDVMIDNLFWLPKREGFRRCGFIDHQDARWGPVSYDLVSLLQDARRDVSGALAREMIRIYLKAFPRLSREDFMASYALWGAQRNTRILGVFSRLARRDGKDNYLQYIPRVWKYLEQNLAHPSLAALRKWFEQMCL